MYETAIKGLRCAAIHTYSQISRLPTCAHLVLALSFGTLLLLLVDSSLTTSPAQAWTRYLPDPVEANIHLFRQVFGYSADTPGTEALAPSVSHCTILALEHKKKT